MLWRVITILLEGSTINNVDCINKLLIKDTRNKEVIELSTTKIAGFDQYISDHSTIKIKLLFFDFN
ncbi:hypothetical protein ABIB39_003556 [Mucilaginibacter sp. UYP27]